MAASAWRKLRNVLLAVAVIGSALTAAYLLWLRDLPVVAIEKVKISGLPAKNGEQIRRTLTATAEGMTTLHVRRDELLQAVAAFPAVRTLRVDPGFPDTLKIQVVQQQPVATFAAGTSPVAVAADGALLSGLEAARLPRLAVQATASDGRLGGARAEVALAVLAAAPGAMRRQMQKVFVGAHGVTAVVRNGPAVYFGGSDKAATKWFVAARLLAEPEYRSAKYLDVTVPEHPAVGGATGGATGVEALAGAPAASGSPAPQPGAGLQLAQPAAPGGTVAPGATPQDGTPQAPASPGQVPTAPSQAQPAPSPAAPQSQATGGTQPSTTD